MIRAVKAINYLGQSLLMRLDGREDGSLLLWNVDGISPGSADINVTEVASTDGAYFNSARQNSREITLTLLLNWAPNIESARKDSYAYFPLKKPIRLIFYSDTSMRWGNTYINCARYIDGYVQQNTVEIFGSKNCAAQIVIKCPDPYFYEYPTSTDDGVVIQYTKHYFGEPLHGFEFPFEDPQSISPSLYFGEANQDNTKLPIMYPTDAANTGMDVVIRILKDIPAYSIALDPLKIVNKANGGVIALNMSRITTYADYRNGYLAGDAIVVSSVRGHKDITISRQSIDNGEGVSILGIVNSAMTWPEFEPGLNELDISFGSLGINLLEQGLLEVEVSYLPAYEGV